MRGPSRLSWGAFLPFSFPGGEEGSDIDGRGAVVSIDVDIDEGRSTNVLPISSKVGLFGWWDGGETKSKGRGRGG